jgi:uncharacterized protein (TIGR02099 family)
MRDQTSIMPSVRAFFRAPAAISSALLRVARVVGYGVAAGFVAFALLLLAIRFVVIPNVERYRDPLADLLTRQLGQPVELGALAAGWDGWNPKLVIQELKVLDRQRAAATPLLELPEVDLTVAWTSLPFFELRLKQLVIERPRLAIRRDRAGVIHLAGLEFDPAQATDDSPLTEWMLHQRQIVVRDALILWNDDLRNAPQLVLDQVQFRLENRFGRHRFGLNGTPPPELAAPIDVRGELAGGTVKDWQDAAGRLYVRLDYADVAAWQEWLPLPLPMSIGSGKGALRLWVDFAGGEAREIVADLELADVLARLGEGLPELALAHLSGRLGWRNQATGHEIFGRSVGFVTVDGQRLEPATFALALRDAAGGRLATGQADVDHVQLEPLRDIAAHLPLPDAWRRNLARYAPRGTIAHARFSWEGPIEAPVAFAVRGEFANLGVAAQDDIPGATGLSGSVDATQTGGGLKLASREATLDLPKVFVDPMAFDALTGSVGWDRKDGRTTVRIDRLDFSTAHASGTVAGTYRKLAEGPGTIDLTAQLGRVDVRDIHRYLPRRLGEGTRTWLRDALVAGTAEDARLVLRGDLAAFPFRGSKEGQFLVTAKARGATLAYAQGWPPLTDIDADVRFDGAAMTIDAAQGRTFDAQLGKTRAEIADLGAKPSLLRIAGSAAGPTSAFLRFAEESPVAGWIGNATHGAKATGTGRLDLELELPLGQPAGNRVSGAYTFVNNQLQLPGIPTLAQVNGKLAFAERDVHARDIALVVLGGPARISIAAGERGIHVNGAGAGNLGSLRRDFPGLLAERLSGTTDWAFSADFGSDAASWSIDSSMEGAIVDLPAPLGKNASATMPLRLERRTSPGERDAESIELQYGNVARLALHRRLAGERAVADRARLDVGQAARRAEPLSAEQAGLWVRVALPELRIDEWLALRTAATGAAAREEPTDLEVQGIDLDVGRLDVRGRRFNDLKATARRAKNDWKLELAGREMAGTATWSQPGPDSPNGRVLGRLSRLTMAPAIDSAAHGVADARTEGVAANPWPELDIVADAYLAHGRDIGRLELVAHPRDADWRIDRLRLVNDAGRIEADGWWRATGPQQQTRLDVAVEAKEAGPFLARFGYPDAFVGAPTRINGQLAWSGAPNEFDFPTLSGSFRIDVGAGRFTKLDPGVGKLLGVLSLQALPRRITLDFRDVFSEGFAFDTISGTARVQHGVMSTDNLKLAGVAAQVAIAGEADLAHETQRLTVRVQPTLSAGVSAGAALFFLANPLVGAAVGAGALLAQKVLKDPIEQMFSYEYLVTGSWSDPLVTRSGSPTTSVAPTSPVDAVPPPRTPAEATSQ